MRKSQKQHTSVIIVNYQRKEIIPIRIRDMELHHHTMDIQDSMIELHHHTMDIQDSMIGMEMQQDRL